MLRFGWPLLLNGFLMFGVFQGDQFLVGHYYSMAELGTYAAAATLAMAPSFIFGRILSSLMLPIMSQVQNNPEQFRKRYQTCIQTVTAFSVWYAVATIFAAEFWMRLAYGSKYVGAGIILAWLSASNSFRILRLAPAVAAMAKADSQNQMKSNILRVLGVVPGLWFAAHGKPVWVIAGSGLVGECLACFYSFWRLKNRDGVPWSPNLLAVGLTILAISAAAPSSSLIQGWSMIWSLPTAALIGALVGFATLIIFPDSRRQFFVYVKAARTKFAS
jgi:O-antigen/teichoic acid export membrane protein